MNIILLAPEDWLDENTVCLDDRRHEHIRSVLKAEIGDALRVGLLDGLRGSGCLLYTSPSPRDKRQPRMPSSA